MISLITMTQGNPIALRRTIESFKDVCDEFVIGDVCIFEEDRVVIYELATEFNVRVITLPFNFIFYNGFSITLNVLASNAANDMIIYMNVGEVIGSGGDEIVDKLKKGYDCYYLDHATETHRWFRCYNRKVFQWSGLIHEEIVGEGDPYHKPLFTFADTEKDMNDPFKAKVANAVKELVYFNQLVRVVDNPSLLGATNAGWLNFAKEQYDSNVSRMNKAGDGLKAFKTGDFKLFWNYIHTSEDFKRERFISDSIIEFQGTPLYLGKK